MIANLKLNKEGILEGKVKEVFYNYESIDKRKEISNNTSEYSEKLKLDYDDWNITDINYANINDLSKPTQISYIVNIENQANIEGDMVYLNPILKYQTIENPFKLEKREYPIDFGHPIMVSYLLVLDIPANYIVDEKPSSNIIKLPENGGSYSYRISQTGNKVMISYKFNINKPQFITTEYSYIKELYNQIIAKEEQVLVLKKIEPTAAK